MIPLVLIVVAALVWAIVYAVRSSGQRAAQAPPRSSVAGRLQNLQDLHRAGLITNEEHARRREEILKDT